MVEKPPGRHSAGNQLAFYRSAVLWFLPWFLASVVALAALWIAIDALGNEGPQTSEPPGKAAAAMEDPDPTSTPSATPETPTDTTPSPTPEDEKEEKDRELITDGITVQVLDGSSGGTAADDLVDKLEKWGFEIYVVNPYIERKKSLVLWSSEETKDAAQALADHLGWPAEPKPQDLSGEVSIHVLVGRDAL